MELQERKTTTTVMRSMATFLSRLCLLDILENIQEVENKTKGPGQNLNLSILPTESFVSRSE